VQSKSWHLSSELQSPTSLEKVDRSFPSRVRITTAATHRASFQPLASNRGVASSRQQLAVVVQNVPMCRHPARLSRFVLILLILCALCVCRL
jgi:hypothetical protein